MLALSHTLHKYLLNAHCPSLQQCSLQLCPKWTSDSPINRFHSTSSLKKKNRTAFVISVCQLLFIILPKSSPVSLLSHLVICKCILPSLLGSNKRFWGWQEGEIFHSSPCPILFNAYSILYYVSLRTYYARYLRRQRGESHHLCPHGAHILENEQTVRQRVSHTWERYLLGNVTPGDERCSGPGITEGIFDNFAKLGAKL